MPWHSLRNALLFNAVFSLACALPLLLMPATVAAFLGDVPAMLCLVLGVGLLVFALEVAWVATRKPVSQTYARLITYADLAWVVATPVVMLAASSQLSGWGQIVLLDVALVTGFCAWCQWRGLSVALPKAA